MAALTVPATITPASAAFRKTPATKPTAKTTAKPTTKKKVVATTIAPVPQTTVPPTAVASVAAQVPASPLEFKSCGTGVECTTVSAPLDPADPAGERVDLFVSRRKANNPAVRIGVLFVNPGGPGGPTFDLVRNASLIVSTEVLDHFDIIGVDPRGTERSSPLVCSGDSLRTISVSGQSQADRTRSAYSQLAQSCRSGEGHRLDFLDTPTAAKDIDAVRAALGEDKISFIGLSYGTYLGATYQSLFPAHTARMILDSAITPDHFGTPMFTDRAAAKEVALDGFLASCMNGQLAPCAFNDGTDLKAKYIRVRNAFVTSSRSTATGERVFDETIDSLIGYPKNGWPILGRALQELASNSRPNFTYQVGDYRSIDDRERQAPQDTFSELTNLAINCRDGILPRSAAAYDFVATQIPQIAPRFSGLALASALTSLTCLDWPALELAVPTFKPLGIPTLVIANRYDLTTPLLWSQTLAGNLTAPLLVREGGGHVAVDKSICVRDAVARFLIDAVPSLTNNSCPG